MILAQLYCFWIIFNYAFAIEITLHTFNNNQMMSQLSLTQSAKDLLLNKSSELFLIPFASPPIHDSSAKIISYFDCYDFFLVYLLESMSTAVTLWTGSDDIDNLRQINHHLDRRVIKFISNIVRGLHRKMMRYLRKSVIELDIIKIKGHYD